MKKKEIQKSIRLLGTQVLDLDLKTNVIFNKNITDKLSLNINHEVSYPPKDENAFIVAFVINIFDKEEEFYINLKFAALFESSIKIDEEFKKSSFVNINAPAIAFPYVRSFITNLSVSSGYNPIIFPAINFTKSI